MGWARSLLLVAVLGSGTARAGEFTDCGCVCDGQKVPFSCSELPASAYSDGTVPDDFCVPICGRVGASPTVSGGSYAWVGQSLVQFGNTLSQLAADQRAGQAVEIDVFDDEFERTTFAPSSECREALAAIERTTREFEAEADRFAVEFVRKDYERTLKKLAQADNSKGAWADALEAAAEFAEKLLDFAKEMKAYVDCWRSETCSPSLITTVNKSLRKLFATLDSPTGQAAERVDAAATFLEDYGTRLTQTQLEHARRAASCGY